MHLFYQLLCKLDYFDKIKLGQNNISKMVIKMFIFYYLQVISNHLRLDRGSETGHMATIHSFLLETVAKDLCVSEEDTVHYGTSTNNKVYIYFLSQQ